MSDENQGGPIPGEPIPGLTPDLVSPAPGPAEPSAGPPTPGMLAPSWPPGMLAWAVALAVLGLGALLLLQVEAAFLVGVAGLFVVAQGADVHPSWRRAQDAVAWITPVASAVFLGALAFLVVREGPPGPVRIAVACFSGLGALASLAGLSDRTTDGLVRLLFPGAGTSHTLRLTARVVLFTLWLALPAWFVFEDAGAAFLADPAALVNSTSLSGGLVGYAVLALAGVGLLVRRDWRATFERLGLRAPGTAELLVVPAGVLALWLFNAGSESLQRSVFPALWASDQRFTETLARSMGPGLIVLLGLSAGVGEEITLRGALQPKLGIVLTSLLFAVLHVQYSWYGVLSIFFFGLILGLIRLRSSTTACIVVHAVYNMLALVVSKP